jgi:hypothetical protein
MTDAAKKAQRRYQREYRKKNRERIREIERWYWVKKAEQTDKEQEVRNGADNA